METAIEDVLADGLRTPDIASADGKVVSTSEFTDAVIAKLTDS
ncbi:MAG: hypothetical protein AAF126_20840 [Chloroflexota bacterium]